MMRAAAGGSHRWLLFELTRREIASRYFGSVSGLAWTVLAPLAQLAIFAFVFAHIFRAGVPPEYTGVSYTAFVAVALWPWIMFSDGVLRAMNAITGNAGVIRKVALPTRLFVYSAVLACYAIHLAGYVGVVLVLAATGENIHLAGLPIAVLLLAPYLALAMGVGLLLAALHAVLRDVEHVTAIVLNIVFYATPILYPLTLVPAEWRRTLLLNPVAYLSERLRDVLLLSPSLRLGDLAVALAAALFFAVSLWLFERMSPHLEEFL
jgi:lipopolysaccharide transport system permease protein